MKHVTTRITVRYLCKADNSRTLPDNGKGFSSYCKYMSDQLVDLMIMQSLAS